MTSTPRNLPAWLDSLAASWDGCMHDAPGEMIDIGASIRAAAMAAPTQCLHQIAEPAAPQAAQAAVPVEVALLTRILNSLASFADDGRWAQSDMDTLDDVSRLLAAAMLAAHPAEGVPALDLESLAMPQNPHSAANEPAQHIAWAQGAGAVFATVEAALAATPAAGAPAAQEGQDAPKPALLAEKHTGMKVDYRGLLGQAQRELKRAAPGHSEMLRQLECHITEMGQRWYAGDTAVVDELLQLYCVEKDARAAIAAQAAQGGA
ncbi:MAG: hypothetical protein LBJ15_00850 [Comamonas sp.]|jgi:hypothetical protein|uniref:hypothetical protein n=1 Tax=Comamonas sp. TaxID=34028 RepID=UPI00281DB9C0|nr:hypothetical protein [Comamonas sp.]MDR0212535.1 hypothetical protein [Comamonas sp.]